VQLTLTGPSGSVVVGGNSSATVTITEVASSQLVTLGSWESGFPNLGPQNDGIPLLLKYASDINPSVPMTSDDYAALPVTGLATVSGTQYLTLTYRRYLYATGITISVQTSSDLEHWTTVSPPDFSQQVGVDADGNPMLEVGVKISGANPQFIRLDVTSP
jgi:hypothetical protein